MRVVSIALNQPKVWISLEFKCNTSHKRNIIILRHNNITLDTLVYMLFMLLSHYLELHTDHDSVLKFANLLITTVPLSNMLVQKKLQSDALF